MNDTGLSSLNNVTNASAIEFYEMEPAVVLDVILDETHPLLKNKHLDVTSYPENYKDVIPPAGSIDYTWIGRVLVRQCFSQQGVAKEKLNWALPLDVSGVVEYPLINEPVVIVKYFGNLYYTKRLDVRGFLNNSGDYKLEKVYGINSGSGVFGPLSLLTNKKSKTDDYVGSLGKYFLANNKIRRLRKFEGDTTIESRFGQSIRFAAYDEVRKNDVSKYVDYSGDKSITSGNFGGGNPMLLIRNRQRKLSLDQPIKVHDLLPHIPAIKDIEKNVGGIIEEDINHDGSSIHMTSGLTETKWKSTVYKSMFGHKSEEQSKFNGSTSFTYPKLDGDQIVINTDRLIFSSRFGETLHYSKKKYGISTDSEYTLDAQDQIVITTNNKTVINSPAIYLGQYDETNEPALLGQTSVDWLYDLCTQLNQLCNWLEKHVHVDKDNNHETGIPIEQAGVVGVQTSISQLQNTLNTLMSRRVFITGGGHAAGADGKLSQKYDGDAKAITINTSTGEGVPGGFKGANRR
jgi:hypothetical protein